ncbi:MAG: hypothetical protein LBS05_08595 [Tannerellaceae bacterium]|nr:hypothetical protein [Tannerellaceae bacterium]
MQIETHATAWGIPANEVSELREANDDFATLQNKSGTSERTPLITEQKNIARRRLVGIIRTLATYRLKNPAIGSDQRISLGLHVKDTKPAPIPAPKTIPTFSIDPVSFRHLKIHFHDQESSSLAKPYGMSGALIVYDVLDAPVRSFAALTRSVLATRTPHVLEFPLEESGKMVHVALCWQNKKGERGPFSVPMSVHIP